MAVRISRPRMPTCSARPPATGVRLADTELFIEVEADRTVYGEEVKFGGGKVIRDGMGQSQRSRGEGAVDTVITNALILDIGASSRRYRPEGRADRGDRQGGQPRRPARDRHSHRPRHRGDRREGKIVTAGGVDMHIHFICPQQIEEAL